MMSVLLIHNAKALLFWYPNSIKTITTIELSSYNLIEYWHKIIATVINSRTQFYFNWLNRSGQNVFIKERRIGDNIRHLFDAIGLTAVNEIPVSIFTADIFKAFDSLNWKFMFRVVLKYNFGSIIVQSLKIFYTMRVV